MMELSKFIVKNKLWWRNVFLTIRRHFGERRNDYGHFSAKYLENCRGITGIIPADLK